MSQIQEKYNRYEVKCIISDLYSTDELKRLFIVIPELLNLYQSNFNTNLSSNNKNKLSLQTNPSENINHTKINKFSFFKIILSKLKSYFEINESFIIKRTLEILINEIEKIEKYFIIGRENSKNKRKKLQKSITRNEKDNAENKFPIKYEKISSKKTATNRGTGTKTISINNPYFNLFNRITNPYDTNTFSNKKKINFKIINKSKKKDNTEINSFSKINDSYKDKNIKLNETERKISNLNLSLTELKKNEFRKMFEKEKTSSEVGLKINIDSNNNIQSQDLTPNLDINNNYNSKGNKTYIKKIKNKSELFNNSNNLYINIYEQKKSNYNLTETNSLSIKGIENSEVHIEKENPINKLNNNNILNLSLLRNIETDDFDIFELDKKCNQKTLLLIGCYIFNRFGFYNIMKFSMFENWCKKIAKGYERKNPYHTDLHAGDITQTLLAFFKIGKINEICKLNQLSKCSLFLSCICHDFKHPGLSNNFLTETKNILAIKYNDNSILENMHISEAFKLTIDYPNCDIFSGMSSENYKTMRKEMISCVLFTDMSKHEMTMDFMKEIINIKKNNNNKDKNQEKDIHQDYMNLLIHASDISNPTKKFDIYYKWAEKIVEEFFRQGDKEKELGIKCSYDRETMSAYQNQLGFINYIEIPFFGIFVENFPKLKYLMDNLKNNKNKILILEEKDKENDKRK